MVKIILAIAASSLLLGSPALGREWPPAGGWDIIEGEEYCAITSEFEGPGDTEVTLILNLDGTVLLSVSNYAWSIEKAEELDLTYYLNGTAYGGGKAFGVKPGSKAGFVSQFNPAFVEDFVKSTYLQISRGETMVDKLSLDGSAAAVTQARRCLAHVKSLRQAEQREKARWAHIPNDPFAGAEKRFPPQPPKGNIASYVSLDDYPPEALRAGEHGTTSFQLVIGLDGRVTDCKIASSSGSAALDSATCRLLTRRARFTPARDEHGNPTEGMIENHIRWTLPAK